MHSGGFELTKLTYTRLEVNLIEATGATGTSNVQGVDAYKLITAR